MVSEMGTNGEGNATLDSGRGLCFPSPSPNGSCNRLQDAGRAAPASHPATVVTGAGVVGMGTLDPGPWINQGVNGDGKEDPAARACEKATGPILQSVGPVPRVECNLSYDIPCGAFVDGGANLGKVAEDPLPTCEPYDNGFDSRFFGEDPCQ